MFSPVKANGDFKLLIIFARELNVLITIDVPLVHTNVVSIIIVVTDVVLMNNVEIIL